MDLGRAHDQNSTLNCNLTLASYPSKVSTPLDLGKAYDLSCNLTLAPYPSKVFTLDLRRAQPTGNWWSEETLTYSSSTFALTQ